MSPVARASEEISVTVPAMSTARHILSLNSGDRLICSLTVLGGARYAADQIACSIDDPTGQRFEIFEDSIVHWRGDFEFTANESGAYTLLFGNADCDFIRTVHLSYYAVDSQNLLDTFIGSGAFCVISGFVILAITFTFLLVVLSRRKDTSENDQPPR